MADIELVIKISEEDYKTLVNINDSRLSSMIARMHLFDAITNGTPLPKGHGRLIDADYFREDSIFDIIPFAQRMNIECVVDHAPTIIEADIGE